MTLNVHRALAPIAFACVLMGVSGAAGAFTLQRLATAIDLAGVAAANRVPAVEAPGGIARLSLPENIQLSAPCTEIRVGVPVECDVTIEIANESGAPLCLAQARMPAGWQKVGFSGRDERGNLLANGVYYYTVTAGGVSRTARVTIDR